MRKMLGLLAVLCVLSASLSSMGESLPSEPPEGDLSGQAQVEYLKAEKPEEAIWLLVDNQESPAFLTRWHKVEAFGQRVRLDEAVAGTSLQLPSLEGLGYRFVQGEVLYSLAQGAQPEVMRMEAEAGLTVFRFLPKRPQDVTAFACRMEWADDQGHKVLVFAGATGSPLQSHPCQWVGSC